MDLGLIGPDCKAFSLKVETTHKSVDHRSDSQINIAFGKIYRLVYMHSWLHTCYMEVNKPVVEHKKIRPSKSIASVISTVHRSSFAS